MCGGTTALHPAGGRGRRLDAPVLLLRLVPLQIPRYLSDEQSLFRTFRAL